MRLSSTRNCRTVGGCGDEVLWMDRCLEVVPVVVYYSPRPSLPGFRAVVDYPTIFFDFPHLFCTQLYTETVINLLI